MEFSPALSVNSDMTDEELDRYFATYVPLSNLPTPPPAKEHAPCSTTSISTSSSSPSIQSTQESSSPELQAQATHLANLVPSAHRPHVDAIRGFLERANLPDEVVAFAACVLDSLSARFAATWREELVSAEFERDLKDFLRTDMPRHAHVSPDVIALAALALAHSFLVDRPRSSRHWSVKESAGVYSVKEIEATKRAMLRDMDYGLARITEEMVKSMMADMQRPKTASSLVREGSVSKAERRRTLSINLSGTAIWSHGVQTPEPSP
ncbi:hypothetical protein CC86DRAFT_111435 [Ophiobolus disseminans]|uniref:Cyclin N-terminal domain-containing protein n=1 Tax=Ophiobolus disseminans TaxID=1469910 RepID=A0A6A6ZJH6_9PLEO|nr:hypothetical protein CC86DRAFT_111435 [Ophiobolus disseminans]